MATFEVIDDSGLWRVNVCEIIMDTARDRCASDDPQDVARAAAPLIVSRLWDAKKPETVRGKLLQLWPIIAPMATSAPDVFDYILTEFAERASLFR